MDVTTTRATLAARPATLILAEARELTAAAYRIAIDGLTGELRLIAGYHAGWWDANGVAVSAPGKAIRPAFALACARAAGGDHLAGVPAAVAVELAHDFSLLHDDVIDGDLTRRHRPTAWSVFGVGQAILAGDALLTAALAQPADLAGVRVLTAAIGELCAGQSADVALEDSDDIDMARCVAMAEGKTGALLGVACELGAMAAGPRAPAAAYRTFGREMGLAFQLIDDLLGIWGDPAATGKPAGSDLISRKKSFPVVAALTSGTAAGAELARLYAAKASIDIDRAASLVEQAGGRAWARAEAARRTAAALAALAEANPAQAGAADLRTLAALITDRKS